MIHIHYFKKVGDWKGAWALKMCRCGMHKLYDLWGFQHDFSQAKLVDIIAKLRKDAGR